MRQCWAKVEEILEADESLQVLNVVYEGKGRDKGKPCHKAIAYLELVPACEVGDHVLLNTTATTLDLGTGGFDFVITIERKSVPEFDGSLLDYGHVMKLRYTPLQREVPAIEEQGSPYHAVIETASSLDGIPVVCCELHSQVPLVAAAIKAGRPDAHIVYCMTDEASLMLSFSNVLKQSRSAGLIDQTISCGQAIGGDFEAVNVYSGLLAAHVALDADIVITGMGPGIVGTGTMFGHGGIGQAQAVNAVASLGGLPISVLRLSFADERPRHYCVSHHSLSALSRVTLAKSVVPIPANLSADQLEGVREELVKYHIDERHEIVEVPFKVDTIDMRGVEVTTMGRSYEDDPAFFKAAWAAGLCGAQALIARNA